MSNKITLIATLTFGLEAVVKRELLALGFDDAHIYDGRVEFTAEPTDIPRVNLWLRAADRVLLKMGEFEAKTFEELFDQTNELPWEEWLPKDAEFPVIGKSVKSQLESVSACQSIVKKAIVERLKEKYAVEWFDEDGPLYTVQIAMYKDTATLTIDTTGVNGLHKRGYRQTTVEAPIKETLAAGLVQLSFWHERRRLIDPMCGAGTIPIEAAMIGRNIAPGLRRSFAGEMWPQVPAEAWQSARIAARDAIDWDTKLTIYGSDINNYCIEASKSNAANVGLEKDIVFESKSLHDLWIDKQYGILIVNPPYGRRIGGYAELNKMYITLHKMFRNKEGWSVYVLTSDRKFPDYFKRARPDRVRKLYNGTIQVNYYQYYGEQPPEEYLALSQE